MARSPTSGRQRLAGWLLGTLWAIIAIACLTPILVMLTGVFFPDGKPTLAVTATVFSHPYRLRLFLNTLCVIGGTLVIAMGLGVPAGFLCFRTDLPGRRWLIVGALLAACIPLYVTTTAWVTLLGSEFWFRLPSELTKALGVAWIQGIAYTPLMLLASGVAFSMAQADLEEQALLDATPPGVWRHVVLPQALWGLAAGAVILGVLCFTDITVTDTLAVRTYPEETFVQFEMSAQPWRGTATSLPIILLLASAVLWIWYKLRHHRQWLSMRPPPVWRLAGTGRLLACGYLLLLAILLIVPLVGLIRGVGSWRNFVNGAAAVYPEILYNAQVTPAAAALATIVGFIWAWLLCRAGWRRWLLGGALILLLATPAPIVGMGLIYTWNHPGFPGEVYDSMLIVILAHLIRSVPLTVLVLLPALRTMPAEWDDAAQLEGASALQRLFYIVMPTCWRSLALAFCLAVILSLSELGASVLVVPPGTTTITVRFLSLIHWGSYSDVATLCLLVLMAVSLPALAVALLLRRWWANG